MHSSIHLDFSSVWNTTYVMWTMKMFTVFERSKSLDLDCR